MPHQPYINKELLKTSVDDGEIRDEPLFGLLSTTFQYVVNDMKKKQREFFIGVMTIFLVVSFVTFLDSLVQVAPAVFYLASQ